MHSRFVANLVCNWEYVIVQNKDCRKSARKGLRVLDPGGTTVSLCNANTTTVEVQKGR